MSVEPPSAINLFEREAIVLSAVWDMIDEMVNFEIFEAPILSRPTNLWFKSLGHKKLFSILLVDFLSQPQARGKKPVPFGLPKSGDRTRASDHTYIHYLKGIAREPKIGCDTRRLGAVVSSFADWLDEEMLCEKVWLSGLQIEFDMRVTRIWLLQVVGDMSKHNFSRLEGRIRQIKDMLNRHGHDVEEDMVYRELPVLYEWFHAHLFSYHASTIAEFLNNIRWAIFDYLKPEFERAYRKGADDFYTYDVPIDISNDLARGMYWELMNTVRTQPYFPQFVVTDSLKSAF